jgi:hypothetical protein
MCLGRWLLVLAFYVGVNGLGIVLAVFGLFDLSSQELNLLMAFICAWCRDGDNE